MPLIEFSETVEGSILKDKDILFRLKPPRFVHRESQHNQIVLQLSPILRNHSANNLFIYGLPGTGKTALTLDIAEKLKKECDKRKVRFFYTYSNCEETKTDATIICSILNQFSEKSIPLIGWNRHKLIDELKKYLSDPEMNVLIILDEIDHALKKSDDILYFLSRINDFIKARVSTIILSNDVNVVNYMKPRVISSFGRNKLIFSPYNAEELFQILNDRVPLAFKSKEVIGEGLLEKISAIEAARSGDARSALSLLYYCALVALSHNAGKITIDFVEEAQEQLESSIIGGVLDGLPLHQKILFLSILSQLSHKKRELTSDDIYIAYHDLCAKYHKRPLTDRMVRTFLMNFSDIGIIYSDLGWHQTLRKKTRRISISIPDLMRETCVKRLLEALI